MPTNIRIEKKKNCPDCSSDFSCYSEGCWCSELPNVMPVKMNEGCSCQSCLTVAIQKKEQQ